MALIPDETYKSIAENVNAGKSRTSALKTELNSIESESASVLKEIDSQNSRLKEVADAMKAANAEVLRLREDYEAKQQEWNMKKKSTFAAPAASAAQPTSSAG